MKTKRFPIKLFVLLAMAALLVWKFWPTEKATPIPAITASASPAVKTTAPSALASKSVVEALRLPPAQALSISDSAGISPVNNGSSLYDASKARAAAPNSAGTADDDYNAIVKGSPGLAKLDNTLAQNAALTQALTPIDPSTIPPMTVTELGEITFTQDKPEKRTLATGDEVTLTLRTAMVNFGGDLHKAQEIQVNFSHLDVQGEISAGQSVGADIQPGQPTVIKSIATGNEIHFMPELASQAGTSH